MIELDLERIERSEMNRRLQAAGDNERFFKIRNPRGAHSVAVGLAAAIEVQVEGHVGYYCGGMNKHAAITVAGHCGVGVGENMMSGTIRVRGNASQAAGASGRGGLLVIEGDASSRCGISMKGVDIVVAGSVGHMSAFMAQAGSLVICGDAGSDLGDSIYEARLYVLGRVANLGSDCVEKKMTPHHLAKLQGLLARAGIERDAGRFRRYGSARRLYNFHVDHADAY
jgi:methylamine---glutamate N-methyltransferase subunit B